VFHKYRPPFKLDFILNLNKIAPRLNIKLGVKTKKIIILLPKPFKNAKHE